MRRKSWQPQFERKRLRGASSGGSATFVAGDALQLAEFVVAEFAKSSDRLCPAFDAWPLMPADDQAQFLKFGHATLRATTASDLAGTPDGNFTHRGRVAITRATLQPAAY